jgi:hypothetical protein
VSDAQAWRDAIRNESRRREFANLRFFVVWFNAIKTLNRNGWHILFRMRKRSWHQ